MHASPTSTPHVAVIYHSGGGHTAAVAQAVAAGILASGAQATLLDASQAIEHMASLPEYDAFVFGSPTYMGSVSAAFKHFMEETRAIRGQLRNKVAAGFTNSASQSGDKLNSLIQLSIFAAQHGMIWVGLDLKAGNNSSLGSAQDLNRLGSFLGVMTQSNMDEDHAIAPPVSDRETAAYLGKRVVEIASFMHDKDVQPSR